MIRSAIEEGSCFDSFSRLVVQGTVSFLKEAVDETGLKQAYSPYFLPVLFCKAGITVWR